ncbi:MAG TPA: bifunctional 5,10-methylenetetrahydrofolate dehydrogenase/5,10-methenyltetrahydrofolate cyclohydrolase [Acholeplasmataceae bacterium]|jgi:methylenetetrahydrofolate dehydrogenase (NADP+)/methenyltetrahydrofolate cyclohydrolase|nr:bifunctional 5,10-methylenetetrahydrofolate dehydrogenase/5,10-methenyltetrahydrofolate cyclohydrolase [Acholeplasmataceae bacterium]
MVIMNGKEVSKLRNEELKQKIDASIKKVGRAPSLAVILVGDDPASHIYVNSKVRQAKEVGINSTDIKLPESTSSKELADLIKKLNDDDNVDGILIQLPLPKHIKEGDMLDLVDPNKDVDGFSVLNQGKLFQNRDSILSATPKGIINLIDHYKIELEGINATVIGRSLIVGMPMAKLLLNRNATVTTCHRYTKNLVEHTKNADLIVVATGQKHLIKKDMVKEGVIIIDVGINREGNKIYGDVDYENVKEVASYITPVPGGVGPMTISALLENVYEVFSKKFQIK